MIKGLHHISIIVSKEEGLLFYKRLGFEEVKRIERGYDSVVYLETCGITLEIYMFIIMALTKQNLDIFKVLH